MYFLRVVILQVARKTFLVAVLAVVASHVGVVFAIGGSNFRSVLLTWANFSITTLTGACAGGGGDNNGTYAHPTDPNQCHHNYESHEGSDIEKQHHSSDDDNSRVVVGDPVDGSPPA